MLRVSVISERRNFRRAGTLKKSERTSICVPGASPPSRTVSLRPPFTRISVPATAPCSRVVSRKRETLAMLGNASPRKPSVLMAARSAAEAILLVACRSSEAGHHRGPYHSRHRLPECATFRLAEFPPRSHAHQHQCCSRLAPLPLTQAVPLPRRRPPGWREFRGEV